VLKGSRNDPRPRNQFFWQRIPLCAWFPAVWWWHVVWSSRSLAFSLQFIVRMYDSTLPSPYTSQRVVKYVESETTVTLTPWWRILKSLLGFETRHTSLLAERLKVIRVLCKFSVFYLLLPFFPWCIRGGSYVCFIHLHLKLLFTTAERLCVRFFSCTCSVSGRDVAFERLIRKPLKIF
jgi:hypothetical protein